MDAIVTLIRHKANIYALTKKPKSLTPIHSILNNTNVSHQDFLTVLPYLINQPHFFKNPALQQSPNLLYSSINNPQAQQTFLTHPNFPLKLALHTDISGNNILHFAVAQNAPITSISLLLQHPNLALTLFTEKNKQQQTPSDIAIHTKNGPITQLFKSFQQCLDGIKNPQTISAMAEKHGWLYLVSHHMEHLNPKAWMKLIIHAMIYRQDDLLKRAQNLVKNKATYHHLVKDHLLDNVLTVNMDLVLIKAFMFPQPFFAKTKQLDNLKTCLLNACQTPLSLLRTWLAQITLPEDRWKKSLVEHAQKKRSILQPWSVLNPTTLAWQTKLAQCLPEQALSNLALTSHFFAHRFHPQKKVDLILALCENKPCEDSSPNRKKSRKSKRYCAE